MRDFLGFFALILGVVTAVVAPAALILWVFGMAFGPVGAFIACIVWLCLLLAFMATKMEGSF